MRRWWSDHHQWWTIRQAQWAHESIAQGILWTLVVATSQRKNSGGWWRRSMDENDRKVDREIVVGFRRSRCRTLYFFSALNAMVGADREDSNIWCMFCTDRLKNQQRSQSKLRGASRDTVRLLQALVDLSSLKIINSRTINLTNINAVVDNNPNWWKKDHGSVRLEGLLRPWQLCEDGESQG